MRKCRLPPGLVGVHYLNRDGIGVNATRCDELLGDFVRIGFCGEEADHDSICVEEEVGKHLILNFNVALSSATEYLAQVSEANLSYGTVAHSHVNQVCRNVAFGAKSTRPGLTDADGRLCLELVQKACSGLARAAREGLLWEVLSGKMISEEKDAVYVIQSAINVKGGVQLVEHEMQAIARISRYCQQEMDVVGHVLEENVRRKIAATMPELAQCSEFRGLLAFVVDLGAEGSMFIFDLRQFHSKFVNAKRRRLRAATFCAVSELSEKLPELKVALIMFAYSVSKHERSDPNDPFIDAVRLADVRKLQKAEQSQLPRPEGTMAKAEQCLAFLRTAAHATDLKASIIAEVRASAAIGICRVLLNKRSAMPADMENCTSVEAVAEVCFQKLRPGMADSVAGTQPWKANLSALADSVNKPHQLHPIVLKFRDGAAVNAQQQVVEETATWSTLDWAGTLTPSASSTLDAARMQIYKSIRVFAVGMPTYTQDDLEIVRCDKKTCVKVKRRFAECELALPPILASMMGVVEKSVHPHSIQVALGDDATYRIVPQIKYEAPGGQHSAGCAAHAFLPPFWLARRASPRSKPPPTCKLVEVKVDSIATAFVPTDMQVQNKTLQHHEYVTLPVMTNTRVLEEGEELVLGWDPTVAATPKAKAPAPRTWRSTGPSRQANAGNA